MEHSKRADVAYGNMHIPTIILRDDYAYTTNKVPLYRLKVLRQDGTNIREGIFSRTPRGGYMFE